MLDSRQLLEKGHLFGNELGGSSKEKASASVGFVAGYEACQREYEEKLLWIPVEEENPPVDKHLNEETFKYSITVEVKNDIKIQSAYFNTETGQWRSLITGCIINPTHWRYFL